MNVTELFIRRPVMTTLVMGALLIFGIVGYVLLPVSNLPNVDFPTILVSASFSGASPETMASAVATPLEKQFSAIAGLDSMSSASSQGSTKITLQFNLNRNIDAAAQDVQTAIARAQRQLPADMPSPPWYRKVNPAAQSILLLSFSSATLPLSTVDEYAETYVAQRLSMVSGVAEVQVFGSQKYAVRIQLNPNALASRGIGIDEVAGAIQKANVEQPTGILYGKFQAFNLQADGQLFNARAYLPLVVAYRNGAPVRLLDLGRVLDSVENDKIATWRDKTRAVVLAIKRQPGTNTVQVVDAIRAILPKLRSQIPGSVHLDILYDRSQSIRASVWDVQATLAIAFGLVVFVIFLFLRNFSATIVTSLALPISIIGTFAAMYLLGYTLDNLSLMALTLSVGFVVDDAIVMLENIVRHLEKGKPALRASLEGSKEVGFTILSMTLSLAAVFIPVLFLGGIVGRLLHEFAVTIGVAVLISGAVSLSLTPMLCSRFLRQAAQAHGAIYTASERFFQGMLSIYRRSLEHVLRHRLATLVFFILILLATTVMFKLSSYGFLPSEDIGQIVGSTEGAQGISFQSMVAHQRQLANVIARDPNIESFMSTVEDNNSGRFMIHLKPRSQRRLSADRIIQALRPKLAKFPGIRIFLRNVPPIRIGGHLTKSQYQYTLQSPDIDDLYKYAAKLETRMQQLPGLQDVTSDLQIKNPQVSVRIDRDKAAALGVSVKQVEDALYDAYGARQISNIFTSTDQYPVIVELEPQYQAEPASLSLLYVRSSSERLVPLDAVTTLTRSVGPLSINHQGQLPSVTISFDLAPGFALGDAVTRIQRLALSVLPATISTGFQGTAQAFQSSVRGMGIQLLMAVLVIYIVLGILYESFIHPLTILSGLPAAAFGALVTLWIFHQDLDLYAFVGMIMLVGIVKKNAIMMIDFALDARRTQGKSPSEAIFEGCLVRFRPIMMTTMAALMATLPIAVGFGAGAESRRPLGLAVVGGLLFSQLLTLYITPVIFVYLESAGGKTSDVAAWQRPSPAFNSQETFR